MTLSPRGWMVVIALGFVGAMVGTIAGFYVMSLLGSDSVGIGVLGTFGGATVAASLTMRWLERRPRASSTPPDRTTLRASFRRRYWTTIVSSAATFATVGWMFFAQSDAHTFFSGVGIPMLLTCLVGFATWLFVWRCPACSAPLGPLRAHSRCASCDASFAEDRDDG